MAIYITSDLHFGHQKEFLWKPRGFHSLEEMEKQIVLNWNGLINEDDDVYVLGDLMLNDDSHGLSLIEKLNGKLYIVIGNHDTDRRIELYRALPNVVEISYAYRVRYKKFNFFLTHYPTLTSNYDDGETLHNKLINLCGHTHTQDRFCDFNKGLIYHCELDCQNNRPVSIEQIITDIKIKCGKI